MFRRIDELGRLMIPAEIRKIFLISPGDGFLITVTEEGILFKV